MGSYLLYRAYYKFSLQPLRKSGLEKLAIHSILSPFILANTYYFSPQELYDRGGNNVLLFFTSSVLCVPVLLGTYPESE